MRGEHLVKKSKEQSDLNRQRILAHRQEFPFATLSEIAEALNLDASTVTRHVKAIRKEQTND